MLQPTVSRQLHEADLLLMDVQNNLESGRVYRPLDWIFSRLLVIGQICIAE